MKENDFLIQLNLETKRAFKDEAVVNKIADFFNQIEKNYPEYKIKKIGDFKYKTYYPKSNTVNLDIAFVLYSSKKRNVEARMIFESIVAKAKRVNSKVKVTVEDNIVQFKFSTSNKKYCFNAIVVLNSNKKYYVCENYHWSDEYVFDLVEDFIKANKISNNLLYTIKRMINFILKDDFSYTYNIDALILRWYYEYIAKVISDHINHDSENAIDIDNFLKEKNLSFWLKRKIKYRKLAYFILNNLFKNNTYFFSEFQNMVIEIFKDVSRYSLNTMTGFYVPINYFSCIKIFNIKENSQLREYQKNMGNESGYSIRSFDLARQNDHKLVCTPVLVDKLANPNLLKFSINKKSIKLYKTIPVGIKEEILTLRSRENFELLNQIAYNFLSSYKSKLEYLKVYFDNKYPFIQNKNFSSIIEVIRIAVSNIEDIDWIIENDF